MKEARFGKTSRFLGLFRGTEDTGLTCCSAGPGEIPTARNAFPKYPELAQCTESHQALPGVVILLLLPHIWLFYMQVHTYISLCVCHILKKDPFNHMPSNNIFWERYMENTCTEQLIRAAPLMCSQIVCRTDRILTGYSFCIFTVFLAQFHPPNPEKKAFIRLQL